MTTETVTSHQTGRIARSTASGIMLEAVKGWFNRSKPEYDRTNGAAFPPAGSSVNIEYTESNERKYIQTVTLLPEPTAANGAAPGPNQGTYDDRPIVTRLSVLKTAAEFVAAAEGLAGATDARDLWPHVIEIAEEFLLWVKAG